MGPSGDVDKSAFSSGFKARQFGLYLPGRVGAYNLHQPFTDAYIVHGTPSEKVLEFDQFRRELHAQIGGIDALTYGSDDLPLQIRLAMSVGSPWLG